MRKIRVWRWVSLAVLVWTLSWLWVALSRWRLERVMSWVYGPFLPWPENAHRTTDWRTPLMLAPVAAVVALLAWGLVAWRRRRRGTRAVSTPRDDEGRES